MVKRISGEQGSDAKMKGTGTMASAGARAYMGVWGLCPQWGPGAKPLVRGLGGLRPPKAGDIFATEVTISCYSASRISTLSVVGKTFKIVLVQCFVCMRNDVAPAS
jgi:hypothetical protein